MPNLSTNTRAGTLPLEIPYDCPGIHSVVIIITYSDGQIDFVVFPYFFPAGMKYGLYMCISRVILVFSFLTEVPKFGLECAGTGDAFGINFDCTLDEEVTSLQCTLDGQTITDCKLTSAPSQI